MVAKNYFQVLWISNKLILKISLQLIPNENYIKDIVPKLFDSIKKWLTIDDTLNLF